ncbi:integrin [Arthrobacter sp. RIT-PI-e]|uniref:rhamnogalacturonan lyase n=1 Tax=Arthrobacter sp. RIT-PI-e TaxID=1681197 RepID=UPI000676594D|nr:rhamnogalacturonan lyase [Arthrobacter sp. RIT-PI-e]KNC16347.1 integrin [Arthrobacter sp. RIT-PI-e]
MSSVKRTVVPACIALATSSILPLGTLAVPAAAQGPGGAHGPASSIGGVQLEYLDRGLVGALTPEGVHLSWRLTATEVTGATAAGFTGADFTVYRDGEPIATVTDSTNYLDADVVDPSAAAAARYSVGAVVGGVEVEVSGEVTPWAQDYLDLPLQKPADGVTPAGEAYTYTANDMSVGDVTGDGRYELVVKWDPSNSKDVSQIGYTGNTYIDTYTLEGRLLSRIDLGVNIRSGAHYTQFMVSDFDGDGRSELMLKTAPGTRTTTYGPDGEVTAENYVTLPKADARAGVRHDDDYRLSTEGYYEHVVDMFAGWQDHPEVVAGNWPATLEEAFGIEQRYQYPLSDADARAMTDYFMDEYAPSRSARNNLRAFEGFVVDGPEYLSVFDGASGAELQTIPYEPGRGDDGLLWGDYAMSRIEPGNRVDRFLAGVAYLDGEHPSAIFARGYYTRSNIVAYRWDGKKLTRQWHVDSGHVPMTNPFNDGPHGGAGTSEEFGTLAGQGFHSLSAADVDGDGKHEIVYGSATIDSDGSLLYSSFDVLPEGSAAPGTVAKLGHGDAMHVADIDPDRPGLEIFTVHEGGAYAPYGWAMRDAATGEVLFGGYTGKDTGRGMIGDIDPATRGLENWAVGLRSASGELLPGNGPGTNMSIRWAADGTTQLVNGTADQDVTIDDVRRGRLLTATGTRTNNGTKGNPSLVADILGDWREELLVRTADSSAIRIFTSTEVTDRKLYTLMHDPQYRAEIARQNTVYNQPAYTGFYLASDTDFTEVPVPDVFLPGALPALQARLDQLIADGRVTGPVARQLQASLDQAQRAVARDQSRMAVQAMEKFLDRLNQQKTKAVSPGVRDVLTHHGTVILSMLR